MPDDPAGLATFTEAKDRYFQGVRERLAGGYNDYALVECRRVDRNDPRPCWELTLRGPQGRHHHSGDSLLLGWENDPAEVAEVLTALGADPGASYLFVGGPVPLVQNLRMTGTLAELLTHHVEIRRPSPAFRTRLGLSDPRPAGMVGQGHRHGGSDPTPGPRVADLLVAHPGVSAEEFLQLQPGSPGRLYVLSRVEPRVEGDLVSILIREAEDAWLGPLGLVRRLGRASRFVAELSRSPADRRVPAVVLEHPFRLGAGPGSGPLVLVVTGTGLASVSAALNAGKVPRGSWLVFGTRTWTTDALYPELLIEALRSGVLARLDVALSQPTGAILPDEPGLRFHSGRVPEVLERLDVLRTWVDAGARVYACGHAGLGPALEALMAPWIGGPEAWAHARESRRIQLSVS